MVDQTQTHQKPQQDCSHPDSRCLPLRPEKESVITSGDTTVSFMAGAQVSDLVKFGISLNRAGKGFTLPDSTKMPLDPYAKDATVTKVNGNIVITINDKEDNVYDKFTRSAVITPNKEITRKMEMKIGKSTITFKDGITLTQLEKEFNASVGKSIDNNDFVLVVGGEPKLIDDGKGSNVTFARTGDGSISITSIPNSSAKISIYNLQK